MRPEQVKILLYGVGVLISVALYLVYLASTRKRGKRTARPRRPSRAVRPNGASVRFVVGRAYWCRDKGWGDSAHQIIRRGELGMPRVVCIGPRARAILDRHADGGCITDVYTFDAVADETVRRASAAVEALG